MGSSATQTYIAEKLKVDATLVIPDDCGCTAEAFGREILPLLKWKAGERILPYGTNACQEHQACYQLGPELVTEQVTLDVSGCGAISIELKHSTLNNKNFKAELIDLECVQGRKIATYEIEAWE